MRNRNRPPSFLKMTLKGGAPPDSFSSKSSHDSPPTRQSSSAGAATFFWAGPLSPPASSRFFSVFCIFVTIFLVWPLGSWWFVCEDASCFERPFPPNKTMAKKRTWAHGPPVMIASHHSKHVDRKQRSNCRRRTFSGHKLVLLHVVFFQIIRHGRGFTPGYFLR